MTKLVNENNTNNTDQTNPIFLLFKYFGPNQMSHSFRLPQMPYPYSYILVPVVIFLIAFLQYILFPELSIAPFVFFFPAVFIISFMGGLVPGLIAVVLSALAGNYAFIGPGLSWSLAYPELLATISFILSSTILTLLSAYFRKILYNYNQKNKDLKRAEENILKANEEWNRTFDAISDLTFIQDKDFRIVKVNGALAEKLKLKPEEIVGMKCYEIMHHSDRPWSTCPFEKTRIDKKSHTEEVYDPRLGAQLLVTTSPIFSKEGEFMGSVHISKDITERKLMEDKLRRDTVKKEALLSSIGDGIVAIDIKGKILFVNQVFADLVNKERENLMGRRVDDVLPLEDESGNQLSYNSLPIFLALKDNLKNDLKAPCAINYLRKKDIMIPLSITATPVILDGKTIGAIAVYRNVSKERAVDRAKTEFVSLAAHQLRTPLASISLSVELLLRGIAGEVNPEQRKYLSETYNSTKTMAELIRILLDISRIELGTFTIQKELINLAENIDYQLEEFKLLFDNKKITFEKKYAVDTPVNFDRHILRIMIENLVTNAIRYTDEGGTVSIGLEKIDDEIVFKITDNGCGIPEEDKDKIFTKLFRTENAKLISSDGAGLGLYLVKSLLDKVESRIWFDSELDRGSTFYVAIPAEEKKYL
jgi:PAS domain S-box-containing protein